MYILQVSAFCHTVLRSAGAFEKSKIQEWPLDGVSDLVQVSSVGTTWLVSSCGVQVDKRSRVEGCDPGSSLGHAHPHGGATTSSASFNGRRGKPFPRARRHCCCSPCTCWPCACCVLTRLVCDALCVRVHDPSVCVCLAVQGAAGAAEKSKIQEWPLYEVSRSRLFADP